jgi:hypothetical protein
MPLEKKVFGSALWRGIEGALSSRTAQTVRDLQVGRDVLEKAKAARTLVRSFAVCAAQDDKG